MNRLPLLGAVLLVGGLGGLARQVAPEGLEYIAQIIICLAVIVAGLSALRVWRRPAAVGIVKLFLASDLVAMTLILCLGFVEMFQQMSNLSSYGLFQVVNTLLLYLGAPVLWGAALARRDAPGSLEAQKLGRLSAGAVQLGYVFLFAAEAHRFAQFPSSFNQSGAGAAAAFYALMQLSELAERILLLWASIVSVRTAVDEETIVRRAVRINRLLGAWLLLGGLTLILSHAFSLASSGWLGSSPLSAFIWRGAMKLPLTFALAQGVFLRLTVRKAGPDTVGDGKPVSGVEA
jgi:hypothetical protein